MRRPNITGHIVLLLRLVNSYIAQYIDCMGRRLDLYPMGHKHIPDNHHH